MKKNEHGQAVLIVLLSLSVVLVIVMYIMSRSVSDLSLSTKDEDAMRAFSAAEAGVERALIAGDTDGDLGEATFNAEVNNFAEGQSVVVYPFSLKSGEIATFWFARPGEVSFTGDQIQLCWGDVGTGPNTPVTPAVEVSVFYGPVTNLKIARITLDPYSNRPQGSVQNNNNFTLADNILCPIGNETFQFRKTFSLKSLGATSDLQFAFVKLLYNTTVGHRIGLNVGSGLLPSQGSVVDSLGQSGDANRRISVYKLHPVIPPIFTNAIYSDSAIIK